MKNNDDDKLIQGHAYDGIQELDNPLPRWWLATFYMTIVFAIGYYAYYEVLDGPSHSQQLTYQMKEFEAKRAMAPEPDASSDEVDLKSLVSDSKIVRKGAEHYTSKCAACHGQKGEGLIGPNLTDAFWIHSSGDAKGLLAAIRQGFPTKGMPPWENIIPKEDHVALAAYVFSLQGTNPEGGKAPQGERVNATN